MTRRQLLMLSAVVRAWDATGRPPPFSEVMAAAGLETHSAAIPLVCRLVRASLLEAGRPLATAGLRATPAGVELVRAHGTEQIVKCDPNVRRPAMT